MIKPSSNVEKLKVLAKQWATNKDIMILADCNPKAAKTIREAIEKEIEAEGKKCPKGFVVPMQRVIDYLDIDIKRIASMIGLEEDLQKYEKAAAVTATQTN
ncbi:MAG: hypothetical protein ACLUVC_00145 [Longibaculum sp.]